MFTDLFSSLDGCFSLLTWMPTIIISLLMLNNKSFVSSLMNNFFILNKFTQGNMSIRNSPLMFFSLMNFIILVNIWGLTPFVYSPSSSLWFASTMALAFWGLLIISSFIYSPKQTAAHLAPAGAPAALVSFLVLIETVSILIRPLTLTVRLIANISAGHIVLSLIANVLTSLNISSMMIILMVSIFYNMFEVFVCFIQAYIFTLLIGLYSVEHAHFKWSM